MHEPDPGMSSAARLVACPGCGGDSVYARTNPFRPFCSRRCKNLDLGAWASETFRVPEPSDPGASSEPDRGLQ